MAPTTGPTTNDEFLARALKSLDTAVEAVATELGAPITNNETSTNLEALTKAVKVLNDAVEATTDEATREPLTLRMAREARVSRQLRLLIPVEYLNKLPRVSMETDSEHILKAAAAYMEDLKAEGENKVFRHRSGLNSHMLNSASGEKTPDMHQSSTMSPR